MKQAEDRQVSAGRCQLEVKGRITDKDGGEGEPWAGTGRRSSWTGWSTARATFGG
jgi:hypothetical protein